MTNGTEYNNKNPVINSMVSGWFISFYFSRSRLREIFMNIMYHPSDAAIMKFLVWCLNGIYRKIFHEINKNFQLHFLFFYERKFTINKESINCLDSLGSHLNFEKCDC